MKLIPKSYFIPPAPLPFANNRVIGLEGRYTNIKYISIE